MNYRIFQNPEASPGYAPYAREDGGYLAGERRRRAVGGLLHRLQAWVADFNRKRKNDFEIARTIEHLRDMSDAQLRDIGISRPDIERAVRFGRDQV